MAKSNLKIIFLFLLSVVYVFCLGFRSYFQIFSLVENTAFDEATVVRLGLIWGVCIFAAIVCCILQSRKVPAFVKGSVIVWSVLGGWLTVTARDISVMLSSGDTYTIYSVMSVLLLLLNAAAIALVIWSFIVSVKQNQ